MKKKKTKNKTQTTSQFKSWIEGIEEMQDTSWHPTADQWKKIRARIDLLIENDSVKGVHPIVTTPFVREVPSVSSALDVVEIVDTGISDATPIPPTTPVPPTSSTPATSVHALNEQTVDEQGHAIVKSKTPNIDTSAGNYTSPFG